MISAFADDIGIVTAFFDIGRDGWTADKNLPVYLQRTTETYFERFAHLAALDNDMVVYTDQSFVPRVMDLRRGKESKTTVVPVPFESLFPDKREAVRRVQSDPAFLAKINPAQVRNPEYWSVDYVMLVNLKPLFAAHAVQNDLLRSPLVAWMDFGYCRSEAARGGAAAWRFPFSRDKIHLFVSSADYRDIPASYLTANNASFISGAAIVAGRSLWLPLLQLTQEAMEGYLENNMVDDDQTIFHIASLARPELFELHPIPKNEWQPVLRLFNTGAQTRELAADLAG